MPCGVELLRQVNAGLIVSFCIQFSTLAAIENWEKHIHNSPQMEKKFLHLPSPDKWLDKILSAIKMTEVLGQAPTWMGLENMMLGEKMQTQKATCCDSVYVKCSKEANRMHKRSRLVVASRTGGKGKGNGK